MKIFSFLILFSTSFSIFAQDVNYSDQELEVYEVIQKLFNGMRAGDSSMVRSVFSNDATMLTSSEDEDGNLQIKNGNLSTFLQAVGSPHEEIWDEKIWNTKVNVEMGLAQVWTDYAFYVGNNFSHCGIDAFHLIEQNGWKIIHLMDTRKKVNCKKPK